MSDTLTTLAERGFEIVANPIEQATIVAYADMITRLAVEHPDVMAATFTKGGPDRRGPTGFAHKRNTPERGIRNLQDDFTVGPRTLEKWEQDIPDAPDEFKTMALLGHEILVATGTQIVDWINEQPAEVKDPLVANNGIIEGELPDGIRHMVIHYAPIEELRNTTVPPERQRLINFPHYDSNTLTLHHYESYPGFSQFSRPASAGKVDVMNEYDVPFGRAARISAKPDETVFFIGRDFATTLPDLQANPLLHGVEVDDGYPGDRISAATFLYPLRPKVRIHPQ